LLEKYWSESVDCNVVEMATKKISLKQCIEELSDKNTDYKFPEQAINQAE
jgi:hypothetical protein